MTCTCSETEDADGDHEDECTASENHPCTICEGMGCCPYCGSASPWRCGHFEEVNGVVHDLVADGTFDVGDAP